MNDTNSESENLVQENNQEIIDDEIEKLEEIIEKEIEYAETIEYTTKGRAIIEVGIKSLEDFFSPYCVKGDEVIHPGVSQYIVEQAINLSPSEDIQIDIYSKFEIQPKTQEKMISSIRRNYADEVATINATLRRNAFISLALLLAGIFFQTLNVMSIIDSWSVVFSATLEIVAWVFLWGAVETFCVVRISEYINRKRYIKLVGATIKFYRNDN